MQHAPLLQRSSDGTVQSILQVELALPLDDVREKISEVGGVLVEEVLEVERLLGGGELGKANLGGGYLGPVALRETMIGVRTPIAHPPEDHLVSVDRAELPGSATSLNA